MSNHWKDGGGCVACNRAGYRTAWAEFRVRRPKALQMSNIRRHSEGQDHVDALAKYLGKPSPHRVEAPTTAEFKAIIEDRKAGKRFICGNSQIGAEKKVERMAWCAHEYYLDCHRKFFMGSSTIAIFQDASGHRMSVQCIAKATFARDLLDTTRRRHSHDS